MVDRDSQQNTVDSLAAGRICVWSWIPETGQVSCIPRSRSICDFPDTATPTLSDYLGGIHPEDRPRVAASLQRSAENQSPYSVQYRLLDTARGESWIEARGDAVSLDGHTIRLVGICQEVSDQRRAAVALSRRRLQQEITAAVAVAVTSSTLAELFRDVVQRVSQAAGADLCRILELLPSGREFILREGVGWNEGELGVRRFPSDTGWEAGYVLASREAVIVEDTEVEDRFRIPAYLTEHRVRSSLAVVIRGEGGRAFGVLAADSRVPRGFGRDDVDFLESVASAVGCAIQRDGADTRQANLTRELRHRVGNLLTVILALFNHSARAAATVEDVVEKFTPRLTSLSRVHTHLSYGGWTTISLREALLEITDPFRDRIELVGADIRIAATPAFALGLAINELMTNAARHGALSLPIGRVTLSWAPQRVDDLDYLSLQWSEVGGGVTKPSGPSGFGLRLIGIVAELQLGGTLSVSYRSDGAQVHLRVPLERLVPEFEGAPANSDFPGRVGAASGPA